jgi:TRAP transporter TAXI family solute receptor
MKKQGKCASFLIGVVVCLMAMSLPFTTFAQEKAKPSTITFGAATVGGFWYVFAGAYGDALNKYNGTVVNVIQGGSIANIKGLDQGVFQMGLTNGQSVPEALDGFGYFKEKITSFQTIGGLYPNVFFIVVSGDSDIHTIKDLKGKKVSPGIKGYSGELVFQSVLKANGMSYDDLGKLNYVGTSDGADLLRDGHIDALLGMLNQPNSSIQELDSTIRKGIRLIPLDESTIKALQAENPGYSLYTIKAGTYKTEKQDIPTVSAASVLLVGKDMPEQFVYDATKVLVENKKTWSQLSTVMADFDGKLAVDTAVGPLHPGAIKYYKEIGVLK